MVRYDDALNRARRLSVARDYILANKNLPTGLVQCDDVLIYLQWLVYHFHTTKMASAYLTVSKFIVQCNASLHTPDAIVRLATGYKLLIHCQQGDAFVFRNKFLTCKYI